MRLVHTTSQSVATEAEAFLGLWNSCDIDRIEVRWPNGPLTTQTFTGVLANYRVEIREGDSRARCAQ
ncbi:MAG: ASPIC/UnbV domain-containing protein [Deltaproteobacteria bacterium]